MGQTPQLADVIDEAIENRLDHVFTGTVGRVLSYDTVRQMVTVQPLIKHIYIDERGDRVADTHPPLQGIPVQFPGAGAYRITWPINKGDLVLLVGVSENIDRLKASDGAKVIDPKFTLRFNLSNTVALPGFHTFGKVPTTAPTDALVVHADKIRLGSPSADGDVVVQEALDDFMTALTTAAASDPSGALTQLKTQLELLNTTTGWKAKTSKTKAE